jgi:hypothetical protein
MLRIEATGLLHPISFMGPRELCMDITTVSLCGQVLLAIFIATILYQARMICLEKNGYVHLRRRTEIERMRERLEAILAISN